MHQDPEEDKDVNEDELMNVILVLKYSTLFVWLLIKVQCNMFFADGYQHLIALIKHPKNSNVLNQFCFNFGKDDQPATFLNYWSTSKNE